MRIGERVFYLLKQQNLTQTQLANSLNTATSTINGWKNNNRNPSSEYIIPICEFFNVSTEYLLTGKESTQQNTNLTENEEEMLSLFSQLSEREQLKTILKLEQYIENKSSEKQHIKIAAKGGKGVETIEIDTENEEEVNEAIRRIKAKSINNRK